MRPLLPLIAITTTLAAGVAGCGGDGGGKATVLKPGEAISMQNLRFKPDHVQVTVGQKVTWRNDENIGHDVKADSGARFASETFDKGGTFSYTPTAAGTIKYECTLHPGMDGTIDVVAR
ncbi:MAG TPA: plastocyanin/azurin family copper-binding protein [Baekduia sp.]|uniref:cupredoxin domain-containing protein n=1 Tax=Baekduia sp. TaxID=2600305 RepID=UPI002D77DFE2|nr:plastocyanin/azurin family copper-binding protein [Baekduia sp.]HET6509814.1 plastocyanin/azurin family copper-binding protein [Baekduia sp.]